MYAPKMKGLCFRYVGDSETVKDFVQNMIDFPDENYGFMLKLDEEFPYRLVILASSDYSISGLRPKLVVYY